MRALRLSLWFFFGVLLVAVPIFSYAETKPATVVNSAVGTVYQLSKAGVQYGNFATGAAAAAVAFANAYPNYAKISGPFSAPSCSGTTFTYGVYGWFKYSTNANECLNTNYQIGTVQGCPTGAVLNGSSCSVSSCPVGQNWTLSGSTCTRPDCTAPQVRDSSTGLCSDPPNPCVSGAASTAARYTGRTCTLAGSCLGESAAIPATLCDGQCSGTTGAVYGCGVPASSTGYAAVVCSYNTVLTGAQCSGGNGAAPDIPPSTCTSKGMCGGTVNGVTLCVPCASSTTESTTKTDTTPGGTGGTSTSTTTQTCTAAGSCSTTTTMEGAGGSSSSTGTGPPAANGKGSAKADGLGNFNLDLPTDYQRDATGMETNKLVDDAGKTLTEIKDAMKPLDGDDSLVTGAKHTAEQDTALADNKTDLLKAIRSETNAASSSQSAWSAAMSSGWWEPVTMAGCQPLTSTFSGKTWVLDVCPTAQKISDIGGYALWFGLVISGFVMLTGGKNT